MFVCVCDVVGEERGSAPLNSLTSHLPPHGATQLPHLPPHVTPHDCLS